MKRFILFFAVAMLLTASAMADRKASVSGADCPMKEDSYVNVNFNNLKVDMSDAKAVLDKKIGELMALGEEAGVKPVLQNLSYNIYSSSGGASCCEGGDCLSVSSYQANGSANFQMSSAAQASEFVSLLMKKGYQANLNVSAYRNCSQD